MKRLLLMLSVAVLALPGVALGKGPSEAVVNGPGTGGGLTITGGEGDGSALSNLSMEAGFFAGAFTQEPSPMLPARPKGDLGPKFTVTYTVPDGEGAPSTITQDVYPYAKPLPVTYMAPGQPIFGEQTAGGWYPATSALKDVLVTAGLPAKPIVSPQPVTAPAPAPDGRSVPTAAVVLVVGLLLLAATAFLLRRRLRPGAKMAGSPS
jgi:hypothetical protein